MYAPWPCASSHRNTINLCFLKESGCYVSVAEVCFIRLFHTYT
nr:MAG TPA: hypothetical protein [Herelleviridae sp.]